MENTIITIEQIEKIKQAAESVKGTLEYNKYSMCCESKRKVNGKWTDWKYVGWSYPTLRTYTLKLIKDRIYMMSSEYDCCGEEYIDRYEVTDAIKELLGI